MSYHYTFTLNLRLKRNLTVTDLDTLRYLFNGKDSKPSQLPNHELFKQGIPQDLLVRKWYQQSPMGSFISEFWEGIGAPGSVADGQVDYGVNLLLPSLKLEGALSEPLALARWLATLSDSVGYVGAITCEDDKVGMPLTLLFVYENALKIAAIPDDIVMESADGISG
jgi:hypothetical protein